MDPERRRSKGEEEKEEGEEKGRRRRRSLFLLRLRPFAAPSPLPSLPCFSFIWEINLSGVRKEREGKGEKGEERAAAKRESGRARTYKEREREAASCSGAEY
jgi:hypothetical protein